MLLEPLKGRQFQSNHFFGHHDEKMQKQMEPRQSLLDDGKSPNNQHNYRAVIGKFLVICEFCSRYSIKALTSYSFECGCGQVTLM